MSLAAYFAILFVSLVVLFCLTVAVAALTGWWIEFAGEDSAQREDGIR
jgi:hypothetical protein